MESTLREVFERHERVALQFSGGKDSLACLYLMRPFWDRLTVYWLNTGAAFPETVALAQQVRELVPHFAEIASDQPGVIAQHGIPSDIVPANHTPIGIMAGASAGPLIQDRYACCFKTIMAPLYQRMVEDGITLVIRGQKNADHLKGTLRSGEIDQGVEYLYPIEDWSAAQVLAYLHEQDAPLPRFYEVMDSAPDCLTCSAYWETGAAAYLKRYHFPVYELVQQRLDVIKEAVAGHIAAFNVEVAS